MNVGQLISRLSNTLDGFSEEQIEILDDPYFMQVLGDAVLEVKRELKRPIAEKPVTLTANERGATLPTDFFDITEDVTFIRLNPDNHSSEGTIVQLIPEYALVS